MNAEKTLAENRRQERLQPKEGLLAAFPGIDGQYFCSLGEILDISETGLSVLYMADHPVMANDVSDVVILTYDNGYVPLRKIPCEIVYDIELIRGPTGTFLRRCGVKFREELSTYDGLKIGRLLSALFSTGSSVPRPRIKKL